MSFFRSCPVRAFHFFAGIRDQAAWRGQPAATALPSRHDSRAIFAFVAAALCRHVILPLLSCPSLSFLAALATRRHGGVNPPLRRYHRAMIAAPFCLRRGGFMPPCYSSALVLSEPFIFSRAFATRRHGGVNPPPRRCNRAIDSGSHGTALVPWASVPRS
jgi:hypothetical protein